MYRAFRAFNSLNFATQSSEIVAIFIPLIFKQAQFQFNTWIFLKQKIKETNENGKKGRVFEII